MKIILSEIVTHFHEIKMSDELEVEKVLDMVNAIKNKCNSGCEAIETVLQAYKNKYGEAFDFNIQEEAGGTRCESIDYEYMIEE